MDFLDWGIMIAKCAFILFILLNTVPIMIFVERRGSALMQNRLGPNRIGPLGMFQALADVVKLVFKEDRPPGHVNRRYYLLAPIVSMIPAFMTFAAIPFGGTFELFGKTIHLQIANLDVGLLYVLSISSLGVYGIIMAAWASNSKYALLGGIRSTAQMVSYELSMGLSIIGIVMLFSSIQLSDIVLAQGKQLFEIGPIAIPKWGVFVQPLGFLIFITAAFAETNRLPFDLPEGESEIVAGYHLEYGAMRFALFMFAEFVNMLTASAMIVTLYFGGWQLLPGMAWLANWAGFAGYPVAVAALQICSFFLKVAFFMWLFVWVRWTLPRFRYDQLMALGWKGMLPLALVNVLVTGFLVYWGVI